MRRAPGALSAVIVSLAAAGCASRPAGSVAAPESPRPAPVPTHAPSPAAVASPHFATLSEAEPELLSLEDRRVFEPAALAAAASSSEASVRARAALALGRIGDARAAPTLETLLADPLPEVRQAAAFAGGILGEPSMTSALAAALADSDARVAARAAWSLGRLEQPAGQATLLASLSSAPSERTAVLLLALWRFSNPEAPWTARVDTVRGAFTIRLAGDEAPMTVMNFVSLARKGYFDAAPIHRVVPNFVVQEGDPAGTGSGGPGWEIRDELNMLPYRTGTVGMALAGPDTRGSQWFVTQSPQPHLDGAYTVFGQIASGIETVGRIEQDDRVLSLTVTEGAS